MKNFPNIIQLDSTDCGPACLKIICEYYNKDVPISVIREVAGTSMSGSTLLKLSEAAEKLGFKSFGWRCNFEILKQDVSFPCIVHWNQSHFVVVYQITDRVVRVSDPAIGLIKYTIEEFCNGWFGLTNESANPYGIVLAIEPTLKDQSDDYNPDKKNNLQFISKYVFGQRRFFFELILGLVTISTFQLFVPILTQSIVDVGIRNSDTSFIYAILASQVFLFIGRSSVEVVRSWTLLHLGSRINISILSDFFAKLMKLPVSYFDTRAIGDILQRIADHQRIERLLTNSSLNVFFSSINLLVFGAVLAWYSVVIFSIFAIGSLMYFSWIYFFLKRRRDLDYKAFYQLSAERSNVVEMISGIQEIKLYNAERLRRWSWERLQIILYKLSTKFLSLEQYQSVGSAFLNELKNIIILAVTATLVVEGDLTLGMMLSISFIVGQLNSPILQLIEFIREWQDARIAIERLAEIHNKEDELQIERECTVSLVKDCSIEVRNVTYSYPKSSDPVIKNISMEIPARKVTAIVGPSGSGKTTLLKLLLKFYQPLSGHFMIGGENLSKISHRQWRAMCGVVMQDGYIFNDSIAENIALGNESFDEEKLMRSLEIARIADFVKSLPESLHTRIGNGGINLSKGERQRILIARAIYKDPEYLFFDEATSALDAENENGIANNLNLFFQNRTVVIIAHRLSTVKNADKIVVLSEGRIIEQGNHASLVSQRGTYFNLVRNQLEF